MLLGALGLAALASGCGTNDDVKKRLAALQDQLSVLQNSNDRLVERMAALELASAPRKASAPGGAEAGLLERPELRVVKVDPAAASSADSAPVEDAAPAPSEAGDDAPRPLIRGSGDKLETREGAPPASKPSSRAKLRAVGQTP
jgi:hypothetical protein